MRKIDAPLDTIKEIILIYANAPPYPIENLKKIEKALTDESFRVDSDGCFIWENGNTSLGSINMHIDFIIGIHDLGLEKAKDILPDSNQKDKFISGILGHDTAYPPEKERFRELFESAFYEVYGYAVASSCPCSLAKMDVLAREGFVTENEYLEKSTWNKEQLNCLQCDHIHFAAILNDLSEGRYQHLPEIVANYSKTSTEEAVFWNSEQPIGKVIFAYGYEKNKSAFPEYLDGLPCNILVDLLSSGPYAKKIKNCPICKKFFFAKDAKRVICYDKACVNKYHKQDMKKRRSEDPGKYC
ncbi:MAG: hypothetical protein WCJ37_02620 [Syntrophus sp. (in: bacteria)]